MNKETLENITKTQKELLNVLTRTYEFFETDEVINIRKDAINSLVKLTQNERSIKESAEKLERFLSAVEATIPSSHILRYWPPPAQQWIEHLKRIIRKFRGLPINEAKYEAYEVP